MTSPRWVLSILCLLFQLKIILRFCYDTEFRKLVIKRLLVKLVTVSLYLYTVTLCNMNITSICNQNDRNYNVAIDVNMRNQHFVVTLRWKTVSKFKAHNCFVTAQWNVAAVAINYENIIDNVCYGILQTFQI